MDRLQQVSTVASGEVQAREATGTAKVYELDDPGGHQHHIVALQVTMDHPVHVEEGHALQDLVGVKGQDALWQRAEPEGPQWYTMR